MVDVQRRRLLEVLGVLGSAAALLGALPEVVHAYGINNTIVDPRSVGNSLITPSTCDVIVQPGQSPSGRAQPMVVTSGGTIIVDSDGTIVSSLGCNSTYTSYAGSGYSCPGGKTLTAGIQEAINYIVNTKGSAGGVVCIAPGTYYVDVVNDSAISNAIALVLDGFSNITIKGAGMDRTVIRFQSAPYTPFIFSAYNASNIVIRDLTILSFDADNNPGQGIYLANTNGLIVEGVHYRGNGILTTCTAADGTPYPCVTCPGPGCSGGLTNTYYPPSSNLVFRNNLIELSHAQLNLRFTNNVLVENNLFRYSYGDHIIHSYNYIPSNEQVPVTNVVIRNNKFLFAGDTVIDIISLHGGWVIEGNYIETAGNAMLLFSQTETDLVINNVIRQYAGAENGITTGFEASANPGAIIIGNRLYNSPGIAGRYVINNYLENPTMGDIEGAIVTFPGTGTDWYVVGNIIKNSPRGIRCGGLYNVNGCTGVVANNKVYMYGPAGPMGGGVFDFKGPIYNSLIVNNYIEGPPLGSSFGCSDYFMSYGITLNAYSSSQGNVITGNTIVNAACAYPLQGKILPCTCASPPWFPILVASPNNVIRDNVIYAVNGQYNYGNLEPIPPGILSLSLTSGTAVQNPYPFDLELEIPVSITATPASIQVYIGQSQSSLSLILQRQYNSTGTDTINTRLPVGWWIQVNTTNANIGTPTVIGL